MNSGAALSFFERVPTDLERSWVRDAITKHVKGWAESARLSAHGATRAASASARPPLVNRRISQRADSSKRRKSPYQMENFWIQLDQYPADVRVRRGFQEGIRSRVGGGQRGAVDSFSDASRRRLAFTARNAFPKLVSQFGMTYHERWPDGATCKKHLNRFLTWFRRSVRGVGYLWIFEFQSRGAPHFHLFLSCEPSDNLREKMACMWNRIADRGNVKHLAFHRHPNNFIDWDMGSGSYLTKYLEKESQKFVPQGFGWAGRFWGCSRGLCPAPVVHSEDTGHSRRDLARIVRGLGRWHERKLKRWGRRSTVRKGIHNALIPQASKILDKLLT